MTKIVEGKLTFTFPANWKVQKFDESKFYREQFQRIADETKAVDIAALDAEKTLWLIEIKDYRHLDVKKKISDLPEKVAKKVRDTLSCFMAGRVSANDPGEKQFAQAATQAHRYRVVLHLEQFNPPSKLMPHVVNKANVLQKLKGRVKSVDVHPIVVDMANLQKCGWKVI